MDAVDYDALRASVVSGTARVEVTKLAPGDLEENPWLGNTTLAGGVAAQLRRVDTGEVDYLAVRADGHVVSTGGIDFAKEADAGTVWQLSTHPQLQGLGLMTRLIHELEARALVRGVTRFRLAVELDNARARRLYEHLGYRAIGESEASWETEAPDGTRFLYKTKVTELVKIV